MSSVLHVHLLGQFRLLYDDSPVTAVSSPRLQSLLAYLVLHAETRHPRHHLAFLLWPDSTESQARTNLRQLLYHLRRALPDPDRFVYAGTRSIGWRSDASYTLDVGEELLALAQHEQDPKLLVEGHYVLGVTSFWGGAAAGAPAWLQRRPGGMARDRLRWSA